MVRDSGCIDFGHLLVALTCVGHFDLMHQASMSYDARICVGGIDRAETAVLQFRQAAFLSSKKRMVFGGRSTMLVAKCKNEPRGWKAD